MVVLRIAFSTITAVDQLMQPDALLSMHIRHMQKRTGYFLNFAFPPLAHAA
jgi:hypothetical protein